MYQGVLRPSSADTWTKCPAQPSIVERLVPPAPSSEPAMEGTCAAWLAEMVLNGEYPDCRSAVGELCPDNNWPVDFEMANLIQGYVDMIKSRGGEIYAEKRVYLTDRIHGTPDCFALFVQNYELHVDDLKYGYGVVEPTAKQIVIYAGAIFNKLRSEGVDIHRIRLGIYQPRAFHHEGIYRYRTVSANQLLSEVADIIAAGDMALGENPMISPGSHCKYCPAAHVCPGISRELYDIATVLRSNTARHLTDDEIAAQLSFLDTLKDLVKGFETAVEGEAKARLESGTSLPGWTVQRGKGRRRFTRTRAEVRALTGIDPAADSMCTPAELERRGADPALLGMVTETPDTKVKLTRMKQSDFAKQFGEN